MGRDEASGCQPVAPSGLQTGRTDDVYRAETRHGCSCHNKGSRRPGQARPGEASAQCQAACRGAGRGLQVPRCRGKGAPTHSRHRKSFICAGPAGPTRALPLGPASRQAQPQGVRGDLVRDRDHCATRVRADTQTLESALDNLFKCGCLAGGARGAEAAAEHGGVDQTGLPCAPAMAAAPRCSSSANAPTRQRPVTTVTTRPAASEAHRARPGQAD